MEPNHVYLYNGGSCDAVVALEFHVSVSSPTLRPNALHKMSVVIPRGKMLDITKRLDIDHDTALQVLADSSELKRFGDRLSIVDGNNRDAVSDKPVPAQPVCDPMVTLALPTPDHPIAPVQVPLSMLWKGGQPVNTTFDEKTGKMKVEVVPGSGKFELPQGGLEPMKSVRERAIEATDDIPSIAWKRERLMERAQQLGIEVVATTSKAAILRKIREKS